MIPIKLGKQKIQHPDNWGELKRKQFILLTPVLQQKEISIADRNRISNYLLGLEKDPLFNFPDELLALHDFLFEDGICSEWFIDLRYGFKKWKGLGEGLSGVKLGRWIYADSYFMKYEVGKEYPDLLKFMAAIYLPNPSSRDILKKYHSFKYVNEREAAAIIFNFKLMKRWLQFKFPYLFPSTAKQKTGPSFGNKSNPWTAWIDIFDGLVGDDSINEDKYADLMAMSQFRKLNKKLKNG